MPGKRLDTNQQRFVLNLISYFRKEFEHGGPLLPLNCIQERVANALGISIQTVGSCLKKRVASPEAPPTDPPRAELLALTRLHIPPKRYKVDEYLQEHGHEVLRLPPYHCQFNAIELIWAQAKTYYDQHIGEDGYGDDQVLEMWDRALRQCTPDRSRSAVEHTDKIIEEWYQRQHVIDEVPEVIIHLGGDNSDEDDDFDDSV